MGIRANDFMSLSLEKSLLLGGVIFLLLILYTAVDVIHVHKLQDEACKALGYEEAYIQEGMDACIDSEGNMYYAIFKCKPWYWGKSCAIRILKVGC